MIRLNRTTEYGLVALRHMSRKSNLDVTSAREIADHYGFPFEITAKTLQRLRDTGLIDSAQGARGGYTLQRPLSQVTLAEFLELMEGPQAVVACTSASSHSASSCDYGTRCEIKSLMNGLNQKVMQFLSGIRLAELTQENLVSIGRFGQQLPIAAGEEP
jgi:Rrf2 family protein